MALLETPLAHTHRYRSRSQSPCLPRAIVVAVVAEGAGNTTVPLGVVAGSREGLVWGREGQFGELARVMFGGVAAVVPATAVAVAVDMLEWVAV